MNVSKELGSERTKLSIDVNIRVDEGSLIAFYGPSGSGKTSLLRMISGLMRPDHGEIILDNKVVFNSTQNVSLNPQSRDIGFCFQDYALFPNMTVRENLNFALVKSQSEQKIDQLLDMMELSDLSQTMPNYLSGGEKQRVALARALVQEPRILLLDEPLSAIDHRMRNKLQEYILQVHDKYNLTTILVSHNLDEVMQLADYVFVLEKGKIIEEGNPAILIKERSSVQRIVIDAEIVKINKSGQGVILEMKYLDNQFQIRYKRLEREDLKVGDLLSVEIDSSEIRVQN